MASEAAMLRPAHAHAALGAAAHLDLPRASCGVAASMREWYESDPPERVPLGDLLAAATSAARAVIGRELRASDGAAGALLRGDSIYPMDCRTAPTLGEDGADASSPGRECYLVPELPGSLQALDGSFNAGGECDLLLEGFSVSKSLALPSDDDAGCPSVCDSEAESVPESDDETDAADDSDDEAMSVEDSLALITGPAGPGTVPVLSAGAAPPGDDARAEEEAEAQRAHTQQLEDGLGRAPSPRALASLRPRVRAPRAFEEAFEEAESFKPRTPPHQQPSGPLSADSESEKQDKEDGGNEGEDEDGGGHEVEAQARGAPKKSRSGRRKTAAEKAAISAALARASRNGPLSAAQVRAVTARAVGGRGGRAAARAPVRKKIAKAGGKGSKSCKRGCSYCGATSTPQWRHHPKTNELLCNACGVRLKKTGTLKLASAC